MKVFIILLLLTIVYSQQTCTDQLYRQYLAGYSKIQPTDAQTWANKKAKFCQTLNQIETINSQNLTYTVAINQFSDLLEEELKQILSVSISSKFEAQKGPKINLSKDKVSAASLNWYNLGYVTSVKDQGTCGCCWAFTATGLYESYLLIQGAGYYDLSQEYILQCTTNFTENILGYSAYYASNCYGGIVDLAVNLAQQYGIPQQHSYPYLGATYGQFYGTPITPGICKANHTVMYNANPYATSFMYYQNVSDSDLKILLNQSPLGVQIYANFGFMHYSSGIYSGCPSFQVSSYYLNHALLLVGYDANGNWIVKNQWSTKWGQNGFARISKYFNCALSALVFQYSASESYSGSNSYNNQKTTCLFLFLTLFLIMGIVF